MRTSECQNKIEQPLVFGQYVQRRTTRPRVPLHSTPSNMQRSRRPRFSQRYLSSGRMPLLAALALRARSPIKPISWPTKTQDAVWVHRNSTWHAQVEHVWEFSAVGKSSLQLTSFPSFREAIFRKLWSVVRLMNLQLVMVQGLAIHWP